MATIANEADWATAFPSEGFSPAPGVYTITSSFTFTSAPNKPTIGAGVEIQGSGYVITIDDAVANYVGLVNLNGGTVINVQVQLGTLGIATNGGGIVAGYAVPAALSGGVVQNCYVRAKVGTVQTNSCGGIVGNNYAAPLGNLTIYRCYVAMTIDGFFIGGIIGIELIGGAATTIDTCYVRGTPGTLAYFSATGGPSSGSAVFVASGSSGIVTITNSYGIGAEDAIDVPLPPVGLQTEVGGFFGGVRTGSTHTVINSFMSGVFLLGDVNGAIQCDDGASGYSGTVNCTNVLYNTSGSANAHDAIQPTGTAELSGYTSAGTNLPAGWGSVWLRNGSYPYLGGTLGFADAPWDPEDYVGPGDLESLALLVVGACVVRGTLIRTPSGEVAIEELKQGDAVITGDGRISKIKNIHHWSLITKNKRHLPRRIPANYYGEGLPHTDLFIHQDHAIKVNDKWVHVNHYVPEFERMTEMRGCEYFHIQLEDYMEDTYIANGLIVEPWDGRTPVEFTQPNVKFSWTCDVYEKRCLNNCEREKISA